MTDAASAESEVLLGRETWRRFVGAIGNLAASEVGGRAKAMFALLLALLLAISGLNVVNSYVGRDFMTAIENRDRSAFLWQAALYIGVFALSTIVAVVFRFSEERLGLLWREWLTRRLVQAYIAGRTYHRVNAAGTLANPDQRISDDVRAFTTTTLSLLLMLLSGTVTIAAFSGVLWSISRLLFVVAVAYAAVGSFVTIVLGRSLIGLSYAQSDKEANFRAQLTHVRENAESIAVLQREGRLEARLLRQVDALIANSKRIIAVNRNLGFFTTGYGYLIQVIPALIVAPLFIRGEADFGVITQSSMAFAHLLGAFSLVVTQFQSISSYAAVLARLTALAEALGPTGAEPRAIEVIEEAGRLAYDRLTLRSPRDGEVLIRELTLSLSPGTRLLIRGSNEATKALFRATAGSWDEGDGTIIRPSADQLLFVPERPYLPRGTLREILVRTGREAEFPDERILDALRAFGVERIVALAEGLDVERDWKDALSLDEQQLVVCARVLLARPQFVFLDRVGTALRPGQEEQVLRILRQHGIAHVIVGDGEDLLRCSDIVLDLTEDGGWESRPIREGGPTGRETHD